MVLRKITVDNTFRYIPIIEKTKEKEIKPKTLKAGSIPQKQNEKPSQNNRKYFKNFSAAEFATPTN